MSLTRYHFLVWRICLFSGEFKLMTKTTGSNWAGKCRALPLIYIRTHFIQMRNIVNVLFFNFVNPVGFFGLARDYVSHRLSFTFRFVKHILWLLPVRWPIWKNSNKLKKNPPIHIKSWHTNIRTPNPISDPGHCAGNSGVDSWVIDPGTLNAPRNNTNLGVGIRWGANHKGA